jgi:DNA-binding GntR family transcriptional regulator
LSLFGYTGITYGVVQHGTPVPPSRQLAAILRGKIESGELQPGDRIPSIVALSSEYGIATVTVRKALDALKAEGLLETVSGYGTFVAGHG